MSDELKKHLLKMKAMGVTITTSTKDPNTVSGLIGSTADRLGMGAEHEVLHFAPWGSPLTSCGLPAPRRQDITDRRAATTCEDCRSRFKNTEADHD